MTEQRWWHLAFAGGAVGLTGLAWSQLETPFGQSELILLLLAAGPFWVLLAAWLVLGRRAFRQRAARWLLWGFLIGAVAVAVWAMPMMAFAQVLMYPFLWTSACDKTEAMWANAVAGAAVFLGMLFGSGVNPGSLLSATLTTGLSMGFSFVMGLWISSIAEYGEERGRLLEELQASQGRLAALSQEQGAADERGRLSHELHDTVAQGLTGLVLLTQRARRELAAGTLQDAGLEVIETAAREALDETRAVIAATTPVQLEQGGLIDALGRLAAAFERETRLQVAATLPEEPVLERSTEVVLLRCAQEALANVRKHAGAGRVEIELLQDAAGTLLRVRDDGQGPAAALEQLSARGFGLSGMRQRLEQIGGSLSLTAADGGGGTLLEVRLGASATTAAQAADGTDAKAEARVAAGTAEEAPDAAP